MDVDDFIMAEVDEKPESQAEKLEKSMKQLHLELLAEERPSSIPPNEPFEDLGLVEGKTEKPLAAAKEVVEEPIIPQKVRL